MIGTDFTSDAFSICPGLNAKDKICYLCLKYLRSYQVTINLCITHAITHILKPQFTFGKYQVKYDPISFD